MAEHTYEGRLGEIAEAGEGAVLCGYSLGGRLALRAALRDPVRYAGLATVGATAGIEAPATRAARPRPTRSSRPGWRRRRWIRSWPLWERQPLFADQSDALVEEQRPAGWPRIRARWRCCCARRGRERWGRYGSSCTRWRCRCWRWPARSTTATPTRRSRIARAVPDGRAAIVELAGHAPQLQRPDEVASALVDFLDQHLGER